MSEKETARPGGPVSKRPLHFFFLLDSSNSMAENGKIEALNNAVRESIPQMKKVVDENPFVDLFIRELEFGANVRWNVSQATLIDDFKYVDLEADGDTPMGKALSLVAEQLKIPPMPSRALPPVLILISDGLPTDDFKKGLEDLMSVPWGKKSVRLAIAIGDDADIKVLQEFIGNPEIKPLKAHNPEQLTKYVKLASTSAIKASSSPASQPNNSGEIKGNVEIPQLQNLEEEPSSAEDVW